MRLMCLMRMTVGGLMLSLGLMFAPGHAQDEIAAEIAKTSTPPKIDGLGDDAVWQSATAHGMDEFFTVVGEEPDGEEDLNVTWKALWDDTNLYVLVEVNDDELIYDETFNWDDDGIELYIDAQNLDEPDYRPENVPEIPAYQFTVIAGQEPIPGTTTLFTLGVNSYATNDGQYPQDSDTGAMVTIDDAGFVSFEVAFPWEALEETPQNIIERGEFGFGVAYNDDDDGASRDTQVMWASESPELWHIAADFPSVALVGPSSQPGDFNGDGVLDASDIDALTTESASGANNLTYDLNADNKVDVDDVNIWVKDLYKTWIGDANLDNEFNSGDLVSVLSSGTYEVDIDAVWSTGDFNGDGRTNSSDLVVALGDGGYEVGPPVPSVAAVPEPSGLLLVLLGVLTCFARLRGGR